MSARTVLVGVERDEVVDVGPNDKQALVGTFEEDARLAVALLETVVREVVLQE